MVFMNRKNKTMELSYLQKDFMTSGDARPLRILSEYFYPGQVFKKHNIQDTIVFFGSARAIPPFQLKEKFKELDRENLSPKEKERLSNTLKLTAYYKKAVLLAYMLTRWSKNLPQGSRRFIIASGGGPGLMEAGNRGASLAGGMSVGLNVDLPHEQNSNPYTTDYLNIGFNYFFTRKYWFMKLAKALVIFPGGFGTMDEFFELLTLVQTRKITKPLPIVVFGKQFWTKLINFDVFVDWGLIDESDLDYIHFTDSVEEAYEYLSSQLTALYSSE